MSAGLSLIVEEEYGDEIVDRVVLNKDAQERQWQDEDGQKPAWMRYLPQNLPQAPSPCNSTSSTDSKISASKTSRIGKTKLIKPKQTQANAAVHRKKVLRQSPFAPSALIPKKNKRSMAAARADTTGSLFGHSGSPSSASGGSMDVDVESSAASSRQKARSRNRAANMDEVEMLFGFSKLGGSST